MGWILWLFESVLCFLAGYGLAAAIFPDRSTIDRLAVAILLDQALTISAMQLCGIPGYLTPAVLACTSTIVFGGALVIALRVMGRERFVEIARVDLRAPMRLWRDLRSNPDPAILALVPGVVVFAICVAMVWYFRSWTWDPVWYHVPKTSFFIQNHTLGWIETNEGRTQGFAHAVELLAAWNCIFQHDNRLDDSSQLIFLVLGAVVVTAWARKLGVRRHVAVGLGAALVALPPIFLQAHSTHNDVACGALFVTMFYFVRERPEARDRWMAMIALGLYIAVKFTGILHAAVLAPWFVARALYELWNERRGLRARAWLLLDIMLSFGALLWVGIHKYVQNFVHTQNPFYPFSTRVPIVGWMLPGLGNPETDYGVAPGQSPAFFGSPNAFQQLITSWLDPAPFFAPDVRSGGFGPAFRWLLVPCLIAIALDAIRARQWRRGLPVTAMFVTALIVPGAWFPRYIIGAAAGGLLAFAMVHSGSRSRAMRMFLSLALVGLIANGAQAGYRGFITFPRDFARAVAAPTPLERAALQIDTFLWPTAWALQRDRELRPGDVFAYDQSCHFLQDLFSWDYHTRVTYVPSNGEPNAYVARLRSLHARWVGVEGGSAAARSLQQAGGQYLFTTPSSSMQIYRMHW